MIQRICHYCGASYLTKPAVRLKYCSIRCTGDAKRSGCVNQCAVCGKAFYIRRGRSDQPHCSRSCATTARNLSNANPAKHRDISGAANPMFGKPGLAGAANPMFGRRKHDAPRWTGGRKRRRDGYVLVVAPDDHPYPADTRSRSGLKYILEHRYVMERHLGRYLRPKEVVHHIDGNPSNNTLANLQLLSSQGEHSHLHRGTRR